MYNHNIGVDSMIFCFKLTKGLYFGLIVPVSALMIFVLPFFVHEPSVFFIGAILVHYIGLCLLQRLAVKKYTERNKVLDKKCDSASYLAWQQEMSSKNLKGAYKILVEINLATAYYYCGDFRQLKYTLDAIDVVRMKGKVESYLYSYYRLWFLYYVVLGNIPEAEKVMEVIDTLPVPENVEAKKYSDYIVVNGHLTLECRKGEVPYIEEKLRYMRLSDELLAIVCEKNFLGKYYLRNGMRDKARECFEFVAEHGNTLFIAKAAKEILEENLNKEN